MRAIDVLTQEHRVIERVLDSLEAGAERLARGETVRPGFFLDVADFAANFADGCHHRKEEGVLFPAMTQHGAPARGGAIEMMLQEHDVGRTYVRQLREAARQLDSGNRTAVGPLVAAAKSYAALLRDHIAKEDEIVFPAAAEIIPESAHDDVMAKFRHVEHTDAGPHAHADLLDLAQRLEEEVPR